MSIFNRAQRWKVDWDRTLNRWRVREYRNRRTYFALGVSIEGHAVTEGERDSGSAYLVAEGHLRCEGVEDGNGTFERVVIHADA